MVIEKCLRKYSDSYYEDMFGEAGANVIDSFNQASRFLSDFALSEESYKDECMPIMNKVFKFFQVCIQVLTLNHLQPTFCFSMVLICRFRYLLRCLQKKLTCLCRTYLRYVVINISL